MATKAGSCKKGRVVSSTRKDVKKIEVPKFPLYDDLCSIRDSGWEKLTDNEQIAEYASSVSFDQRVMLVVLVIHYFSLQQGYIISQAELGKLIQTTTPSGTKSNASQCLDHDLTVDIDFLSLPKELQDIMNIYVSQSLM